ncbi:hypothetical protein ACNOYE_10095 [Nannocystaceae bacterium ST9]
MRNPRSILSTLAFALVTAIGLVGPSSADATNYRDLCSSVPGACVYTGPDAPVLAALVCWSRSSSTSTLMTGAACPTGSWAYFAKYGVVEPLTLHVTAFVPLDDACSRPGLCLPGSFAPPNTTSAPMCCHDGDCWPMDEVNLCGGDEVLFCSNGVSNDDGTITCFDEELT